MLAFVPEGSRDGSSLYSTITKTFFIDKKNAGNDNIFTHSLFSRALGDFHILYGSTFAKGAFTNYVDKILPIIDHLPAPFDIALVKNYVLHCTVKRINLHIVDISTKGQLISKCIFVDFNFFQKTNENTLHSSKNEFIHSFFGKIHGLTVCFQN